MDKPDVYYCKVCRDYGLYHCANPEECGMMDKPIPYAEAKEHYEARRRAAISGNGQEG